MIALGKSTEPQRLFPLEIRMSLFSKVAPDWMEKASKWWPGGRNLQLNSLLEAILSARIIGKAWGNGRAAYFQGFTLEAVTLSEQV